MIRCCFDFSTHGILHSSLIRFDSKLTKLLRIAIPLDEKYPILFISTKTFVVGTHLKRLTETLQMSTTANVFIGIRKEIKIFLVYSVVMNLCISHDSLEVSY